MRCQTMRKKINKSIHAGRMELCLGLNRVEKVKVR